MNLGTIINGSADEIFPKKHSVLSQQDSFMTQFADTFLIQSVKLYNAMAEAYEKKFPEEAQTYRALAMDYLTLALELPADDLRNVSNHDTALELLYGSSE